MIYKKSILLTALLLFIASVVLNRNIPIDQTTASFLRYFFFVASFIAYILYALPRFNMALLVVGLILMAFSLLRWQFLGVNEIVVFQLYQSLIFAYFIAVGLSQFREVSYILFLFGIFIFLIFLVALVLSDFNDLSLALPNHSRNHAISLLLSINVLLIYASAKVRAIWPFRYFLYVFYCFSSYVFIFHTASIGILIGVLMLFLPIYIYARRSMLVSVILVVSGFIFEQGYLAAIYDGIVFFVVSDPRYDIWKYIILAISESPYIGISISSVLETGYTSHNTYLDFFIWFGVLGGFVFFAFFLLAFLRSSNVTKFFLMLISLKLMSDSVIKSYDLIVVTFLIMWMSLYFNSKKGLDIENY